VIAMYYRDHHPPHFHASYREHEAQIVIETLEPLAGELRAHPPCSRRPNAADGGLRFFHDRLDRLSASRSGSSRSRAFAQADASRRRIQRTLDNRRS